VQSVHDYCKSFQGYFERIPSSVACRRSPERASSQNSTRTIRGSDNRARGSRPFAGVHGAISALYRICLPPVPTLTATGYSRSPLRLELGAQIACFSFGPSTACIWYCPRERGVRVFDVLRCVEIPASPATQPDQLLPAALQLGCFWVTARCGRRFLRAQRGAWTAVSISASVLVYVGSTS